MYGRHPRLPIDLVFGSNSPEKEQGYKTFVKSLRSRLLEAYKIAIKRSSSNKARHKQNYDRKQRGGMVEVGDRVLIRKLGLKGKTKLEIQLGRRSI